MKPWRIHPQALLELEESIEHYLLIAEELSDAFDKHYVGYRRQICESPLLYNIREGLVRRVNMTPRFGEYYIAYMIWREQVVILAVAHAKRRPYYWRGRIGEAKKLF